MKNGENTIERLSPDAENTIERLSPDAEKFMEYLRKGSLSGIKQQIAKSPSIISDPGILSLYGNPLLFIMNHIFSESQKKTSTGNNSAGWIEHVDFFSLALYLVEQDSIDLFAKDSQGNNIFSYLSILVHKLEYYKVGNFLSNLLRRKELQFDPKNSPRETSDFDQKYIVTSESQRILNINYKDENGKTLAHYLYPHILKTSVLNFFFEREEINLSISDNEGHKVYQEEIFFPNRSRDARGDFLSASNESIKLLTFIKRVKVKFNLPNSLFTKFLSELDELLILNIEQEEKVGKSETLDYFISLCKNDKGRINYAIAQNLSKLGIFNGNFPTNPNHQEIIKRIVDHKDVDGNSLFHAVLKHKISSDGLNFLEYSDSLNIANNQGDTPLHLAAFHGKLETLRSFLPLIRRKETLAQFEDALLKKNFLGETPEDIQIYAEEYAKKTVDEIYQNLNAQSATFLLKSYQESINAEAISETEKSTQEANQNKPLETKEAKETKLENENFISKYFKIFVQNIKKIFRIALIYVANIFSKTKPDSASHSVETKPVSDISNAKVTSFVKDKSILQKQDADGNTLLHALFINDKILERRLAKCTDESERTRIIDERNEDLVNIIMELVRCGVDATKQNKNGDTAMHLAAAVAHEGLLNAFISRQEKKDEDPSKDEKPSKGENLSKDENLSEEKEIPVGTLLNSEILQIENKLRGNQSPIDISMYKSISDLAKKGIKLEGSAEDKAEDGTLPEKPDNITSIQGETQKAKSSRQKFGFLKKLSFWSIKP